MSGSEYLIYEFAGFRLDPRRRLLTRTTGESVELSGKPLDALIYFVEHAGELVTRSALMEALWPTTVVEDNSLTQIVSALRRTLGDDQNGQRLIVTVSGRGYQFVGEVRASSNSTPGRPALEVQPLSHSEPAADVPSVAPRARRPIVLLASIVIAAAAGLLALGRYALDGRDTPSAHPSSVAVLPFRNLSPNPDDAYFAAGLHEEVLDRLAKIADLTVIGRTSVMGYADGAPSIAEIADDLRVGAVLEGSASRAGERVRVSVRLVAAATNAVLWSEVYDGDLRDVFGIQADIATRIADALAPELSAAERTSIARPPTESLAAYALYLRAIALYREAGGVGAAMPDGARATMQSYLDRAIALDANFAAAYAWKAYLYADSLFFDAVPEHEWTVRTSEWIGLVQSNAERALSLDPGSSIAHVARARLDFFRSRLADASSALDRALASNPNDSRALQHKALLYVLLGELPQAITLARRALELDPKNLGSYAPLFVALQLTGQNAAAAAVAEDMIEAAPSAAIGYLLLARAEIARGDSAKALEALKLAERLAQESPYLVVDLAVAYRRVGALADAERLAGAFAASTQGLHVTPAMLAMALLALGDDDGALRQARVAFESRELGMDPLQLGAIRANVWSLPVLEEPQWRALREEMASRD